MKTKTRTSSGLLAWLITLTWAGNVFAAPIVVDGRLDDWGVRLGDANTSNISVPLAPASVNAVPVACFSKGMCEDQNDTSNSHALGPHFGGQNYDVEFLGVRRQGSQILIGIASGLRPDNGFGLYGPGDLFLRLDGIAYAIEIGGGAGGSSALLGTALLGGSAGSTYTLNSSGHTTALAAQSAAQKAGSIWHESDINYLKDPITHTINTQFTLKPGRTDSDKIGDADFIFTRNQTPDTVNGGFLTQHSVIELSFDAGLFGGVGELEAYWGPVCSNDGLEYHGNVVPEPGTCALFALGLAGFGAARFGGIRKS